MINSTKKAPAAATADAIENTDKNISDNNYITMDELCDRRRFYKEQFMKEPLFSTAYKDLYRKFEMFEALIAERKWGSENG